MTDYEWSSSFILPYELLSVPQVIMNFCSLALTSFYQRMSGFMSLLFLWENDLPGAPVRSLIAS